MYFDFDENIAKNTNLSNFISLVLFFYRLIILSLILYLIKLLLNNMINIYKFDNYQVVDTTSKDYIAKKEDFEAK